MKARRGTIDVSVPVMHPSLARIAEASYRYVAGYQPKSPIDLHIYLRSQPALMHQLGDVYRQFGDRLAATFPGVNLAHAFFAQVAHGYTGLQGPAHEQYLAWRALHAADLARFESPRWNEHYADVARHGAHVASVPSLPDGALWHANHTLVLEVTRSALGNLEFGGQDADRLRELMGWLDDLPALFDTLCRHVLAAGRYLLENMPVQPELGDFYRSLGRGYLGLADAAAELSDGYRRRNQPDVDRRERPRINEAWFDFANQTV